MHPSLNCSRSVDDLIEGISLIGRTLSLWHSLHHIQQTISHALSEAEELYQQLLSNVQPVSSQLPISNTRIVLRNLEIQRLSVVFFRSLLFEGSGLSAKGSTSAGDSFSLNGPSEIPVIPRSVINSITRELQLISETIGGVVSGVAKCVDVQRNLLEICAKSRHSNSHVHLLSSLVSPIVMRSAFDFFADFVR